MSIITQEFSKCGDVLQWGTFGQPQANFLHLQFQNKYAAQRALLRNGEIMSPSLIVGVKPLDPRHRRAIDEYSLTSGGMVGIADDQRQQQQQAFPGFGSGIRPAATLPDRPYRIDAAPAGAMPQPRSSLSKVVEFVFGF